MQTIHADNIDRNFSEDFVGFTLHKLVRQRVLFLGFSPAYFHVNSDFETIFVLFDDSKAVTATCRHFTSIDNL